MRGWRGNVGGGGGSNIVVEYLILENTSKNELSSY